MHGGQGLEFTENEVVGGKHPIRAARRTVVMKNGPKECRSSNSREVRENLQWEAEEPNQGGKLMGMHQSPLLLTSDHKLDSLNYTNVFCSISGDWKSEITFNGPNQDDLCSIFLLETLDKNLFP